MSSRTAALAMVMTILASGCATQPAPQVDINLVVTDVQFDQTVH